LDKFEKEIFLDSTLVPTSLNQSLNNIITQIKEEKVHEIPRIF